MTWRPASAPIRETEVSDVRTGFATERAFVENHAAALLDLEDLKTIRQRIEERLHWEYGKETGTLLDDTEPAPPLDFSDIEKKYSTELGGSALEGTRFSSKKMGVTLMLVEVGGFSTSAAQSEALIDRVRADMKALGGTDRYAPGMRVGFTGDVAISAEETSALVDDLTLSSVLVVVTVLAAIVLFYGWGRSVPALFLPLAVGDGLRVRAGQPAAVRDHRAQLEHGVPRVDHHRQRHQLRHHPARALRRGAAARRDGRGFAGAGALGDAQGDAVGGAGGGRRVCVAGRDAVPRASGSSASSAGWACCSRGWRPTS